MDITKQDHHADNNLSVEAVDEALDVINTTLPEIDNQALDVDAKLLEVDHTDAVPGLFALLYISQLVRRGEL